MNPQKLINSNVGDILSPGDNDFQTPELKFRAAFLKAQKEFQLAKKESENPYFHSKYSSLKDVWDACEKALHSNGFMVLQPLVVQEGKNFLTTQLIHLDGHSMISSIALPTIEDPQKMGSAITYFRRYSLAALLGIIQDDDDAEGASPKAKPSTYDYQKPTSKSSSHPEEFHFTFGKFNGLTFNDIPLFELDSYISFLKKPDAKKTAEDNAKGLKRNEYIFKAYETWRKAHQALNKGDDVPPIDDSDIPF